ncbi:hypothetical protein Y1Q_0015603 [Alligator mississippiensis]|uniref:Uncharacterized protein n=1 Tax=Alligator mississippiensis TaxID=8496 RepID=A0A151NNI4_ALLMI|nr:hypothetical protein Y1Q_0015603 [Alligator mississippiensis]
MAQPERGRKAVRVVSHTFIQLKPAGDVIGNHRPVGIKRTTGEDGGGRRAEPGKTLMLDTIRDIPRERETAGAVCTSRGQPGEEAEEPEEAFCADKDRNAGGTGEPEEALYTIEGGNIWGTQEAEKALPPGHTRREQQEGLRSRTTRGWVLAFNIRSGQALGELPHSRMTHALMARRTQQLCWRWERGGG